MAKPDQYTAEQMITALQATKGMVTLAARHLGCSVNTVQRYIEKYPTVKTARDTERDKMGDAVELALYDEAVNKRNTAALIFMAKTLFKDRGYIERLEIYGNLNITLVNKLAQLLEAQGHDPSSTFNDMIAELMKQNVDSR
jgi:hypothetical protein